MTDLNDRTAFERFALEAAAALLDTERRVRGRFDLRTQSGATYAFAGGAMIGGSEKLKDDDLRPLMFGAAWKILDQVIEFAVGAVGAKHVPISDKVQAARALAAPLSP